MQAYSNKKNARVAHHQYSCTTNTAARREPCTPRAYLKQNPPPVMNESYFTANRHVPASMKPGEDFTPGMFVNDPNRRAPPPMQRPGAGDPSQALEWSPAAVGDAVSQAAAGNQFASNRHATNLLGGADAAAMGASLDRDVYNQVSDMMDVTASQATTPSPFGAGSRHQPPPPPSTNASVSSLAPAGPSPFGAKRHQAAQQAAPAVLSAPRSSGGDPSAAQEWAPAAPEESAGAGKPSAAANPFGAGRQQRPPPQVQQNVPRPNADEGVQWFMSGPPVDITGSTGPAIADPAQDGGADLRRHNAQLQAKPQAGKPGLPFEQMLALNAAAAASGRAVEALERARATLDEQIGEERKNHQALVKMIEQMKQEGAARPA